MRCGQRDSPIGRGTSPLRRRPQIARARLRIDILLPLVDERPQAARDVGMLTDQVVPLTEVRAHVEQERPAVVDEQLPVAGADRELLACRR